MNTKTILRPELFEKGGNKIMKRTPLAIGATLQLHNTCAYKIDKVIGDGASSIVYEAHYFDNVGGKHNVRLKECYPYASDIQRVGDDLIWADSTVCHTDKAAFIDAYQKLLSFQNTNKLRNSTAHIYDLCESNGTLYSVMDVNEGQTFENDNNENLTDILKTILALARVIKKYHNNGYLHLDIKPSNFLVIPETRELVILFDVDSVTKIEDIQNGNVISVPFSKGWAAPEQMQGRSDKICPATDIYSIGAVLFQKIMGRDVENEDIGIFANWNFDNNNFDKVNPAIKRLLSEIFRKTLSANINRRYQSIHELIDKLSEAVEMSEQKQFIKSYIPAESTLFVGRQDELSEISKAFDTGKQCIIIQGIGGMGKSSVALRYANANKEIFDNICFVKIEENLNEDLSVDDKIKMSLGRFVANNDATEKWQSFSKLVTDNTLLIIDNYDVDKISPYVMELLGFGCKMIITTRTKFKNDGNEFYTLSLDGLSDTAMIGIVEKEFNRTLEETERKKWCEFFEERDRITFCIRLAIGQIKESCITLDEYLDDIYAQKQVEDIEYNNDEDKLLNHYRRIARLHLLSNEETEALNTVFVMSYAITELTEFKDSENSVFDRRVFKAYTNMSLSPLNSLIRKSIVEERSDGSLSLHQYIRDLVEKDLHPSCDACPHLYENISRKLNFTVDRSKLYEGKIFDIDGNDKYQFATSYATEMFDIYTYLYKSDKKATKHLLNLFALLTFNDFWCWTDAPPSVKLWHTEWKHREYFVSQLINIGELIGSNQTTSILKTDDWKEFFDDSNYGEYVPGYSIEQRLSLETIRICCALIRFIHDEYYQSYLITFSVLKIELIKATIACDEELAYQISQICNPIFDNCNPIDIEGDYRWDINHSIISPVANDYEATYDFDYDKLDVALCPYANTHTYSLYEEFRELLIWMWSSEKDPDKKDEYFLYAWKISTLLLRINKGYHHFYDFWGEGLKALFECVETHETEYKNQNDNVNCITEYRGAIEGNVPQNFSATAYLEEVIETLKTVSQPKRLYGLYKLLLTPDFYFAIPMAARELLASSGVDNLLINNESISQEEKKELLEHALEQLRGDVWNGDSIQPVSIEQYPHIQRWFRSLYCYLDLKMMLSEEFKMAIPEEFLI